MGYQIDTFFIRAPFKGLITEYPHYEVPPQFSPTVENIDFYDDSIKFAMGIVPILNQGTGTITTSGASITGTGTQFTAELQVGWFIVLGNERRKITAITSNTTLTIESAFSQNYSNVPFWYYQDFGESIYHISKWTDSDGYLRAVLITKNYFWEYNPTLKRWTKLDNIWNRGTVSGTQGAYIITGSGTNWIKCEAQKNDKIIISGVSGTYTIYSVDSDTQITLNEPLSSTFNGATYTIYRTLNLNDGVKITSSVAISPTSGRKVWIVSISGKWVKERVEGETPYIKDVNTDLTEGMIKSEGLAYWKFHIVHCKTTENGVYYPFRIRISDINNYQTYTPDDTNDAYFADLIDEEEEITAIYPMTDYLLIFKPSATYIARYVGRPAIISLSKISDEIGCKAQGSIVNYKDTVFFLGEDGIYTFSGGQIRKISDVIQTFFSGIRRNINYSRVVAKYIDVKKQYFIWLPFSVPQGEYYGIGLGYHINGGQWTVYKFPNVEFMTAGEISGVNYAWTWDGIPNPIGSLSMRWIDAYVQENVYETWIGIRDRTTYHYLGRFAPFSQGIEVNYQAVYSTPILDFGNPYVVKRLNRIQFLTDIGIPQTLYVKIRYGDTPDGLVETDEYVINNLTEYAFLDVSLKAKFFQVIIRADKFFSLVGMNFVYMNVSLVTGTKEGGVAI